MNEAPRPIAVNDRPGLDDKPSGIWPVSSPISNISIDEALALKAGRHEAILVALFGDSEHWHDWQHSSARYVAWMDSIPGDRLLTELFGYSAHVFARKRYQRRASQAPLCGAKHRRELTAQPQPKRRLRKPCLTSVSKQASRAGIEVARYEIKPDGTVVVVTGKSESTELNPWLDDLKVTKQ
jgi:hypothetical protein